MKLRFVWVGKTRNSAIKELIGDYLGRVERFATVEVVEVRERVDSGNQRQRIVEREGREILERIDRDPFVVLLDERGRQLDSIKMAELIEEHRMAGTKVMTFVAGNHGGVSDAVRRRADFVLALSRMTLTHEFARVLLVEQVYRAFTIIHDLPYRK
jgi:23S rRNA (pseudouridine1915-N3)-methyltransferase